jgi:hypothetical protein
MVEFRIKVRARDGAQSSSDPCSACPFLLLDAIVMETPAWTLSSWLQDGLNKCCQLWKDTRGYRA